LYIENCTLSPGTVVKSSGEVTQREVRAWVKDEVGDLDLSQLDLDREQFQYNKILQIGIKTSVAGSRSESGSGSTGSACF
jgi:hypothetical protein